MWAGTVALAISVACEASPTLPAAPPKAVASQFSPPSTTSEPGSTGFDISDVRLVTVRDPVVFWQVSFDARWTGSGEPEETRCRWRMLGPDGVAIVSGGIELSRPALDDEVAASVYPDEIPGVPKHASLDCS